MKFSPFKKFLIQALVAGFILITGTAIAVLYQLPRAERLRQSIDADRAATTLAQQQQANLQSLRQELNSLTVKQAALDKEIWSFATEDTFYGIWEVIAQKHSVTIDEPKIADAIPSDQFITRAATITIHGTLANVLQAIADLQQTQPFVFITSETVKPAEKGTVTATLDVETIWQQ